MKIAIIVPSKKAKGPVLVAADISAGLTQRGHDVTVFYFDDEGDVIFLCNAKKINFFCFSDFYGFDVIHSHSFRPDFYAWLLRNVFKIKSKYVSTVHNYVEKDLSMERGFFISLIFSKIWRLIWVGLDRVVFLSRHAKSYYKNSYFPVDGNVVYNSRQIDFSPDGVSRETDLKLLHDLKANYKVIGANAVVIKRKGFSLVLKALKYLPQHVFFLVGDGPDLPILLAESRDLGVSDRFFSVGFRGNAQDYLRYYDIFVMPSYSEGMPLAMLEAVTAGVPVACSRIPIFEELFKPDEVFFFDLDDPLSCANAINQSDEILSLSSSRAKARLDSDYSFCSMIDGYLNVYGC